MGEQFHFAPGGGFFLSCCTVSERGLTPGIFLLDGTEPSLAL